MLVDLKKALTCNGLTIPTPAGRAGLRQEFISAGPAGPFGKRSFVTPSQVNHQGRNGDPLAPSAHPTYEAKQMQDPTLNLIVVPGFLEFEPLLESFTWLGGKGVT